MYIKLLNIATIGLPTLHHLITHTNPKNNISEYNEPRMKQTESFDLSRKKTWWKDQSP